MHFLCSPFGSAGDIQPMLGLALALQQRGHCVTFAANGYFEEVVRKYGVDFVELGTQEAFLKSARHPDLWNPRRAFQHIWHSLVAPSLRHQYDIFAELYRPGETIGIVNCFGLGGLVAQDKVGIPVVTAHIQPAVVWSDMLPPRLPGVFGPRWMQRWQYRLGERFFIDRVVCPDLNLFRQELGLAPVNQITRWWHSKRCVACLFPPWFCPPQSDWPANLIQTDFPLWDEPNPNGLPADVDAFLRSGDPPIAFTPGSSNVFGRQFFETAVAVCKRLQRRGILLSRFPEQIPANLPPAVRYFPYVPFSELLPRSAAVVHHGGIGSTAQGLAAGIPQLVMPLAHDQFDNAARLKRLGVGDWVKPSRFTARTVATRLRRLLGADAVQSQCAELRDKLSDNLGLARAAAMIEEFAALNAG
jgi:UDP:flavonoid glycosyltransferase YjiC (YdhE family)